MNIRKSEAAWQRIRAKRAARLSSGGFANRTDARVRSNYPLRAYPFAHVRPEPGESLHMPKGQL